MQLSSYGCTREVAKHERSVRYTASCDSGFLMHAHHFFYNIDALNIFPGMDVFIESPAYMRLKAEDQPRRNIHSKN